MFSLIAAQNRYMLKAVDSALFIAGALAPDNQYVEPTGGFTRNLPLSMDCCAPFCCKIRMQSSMFASPDWFVGCSLNIDYASIS